MMTQNIGYGNGNGILSMRGGSSATSSNYSYIIIALIIAVVGALFIYGLYKWTKSSQENGTTNPNMEFVDSSEGMTGKEAEIMLFYVDWCPHCKTAKPEWEQVKAEYDGKNVNGYIITFTEINCTNETAEVEKMVNSYKIDGYPTIKLLKDGTVIEYDAKPTKETLTQFLNTVL
jgi:thiol-disulfide isomerase/thioredoxin